jgi:hypothetical protein
MAAHGLMNRTLALLRRDISPVTVKPQSPDRRKHMFYPIIPQDTPIIHPSATKSRDFCRIVGVKESAERPANAIVSLLAFSARLWYRAECPARNAWAVILGVYASGTVHRPSMVSTGASVDKGTAAREH